MSDELKPCPFCGSEKSEWQDHPSGCYLFMITEQVESNCTRHSKEACNEAWNNRSGHENKCDMCNGEVSSLCSDCEEWAVAQEL